MKINQFKRKNYQVNYNHKQFILSFYKEQFSDTSKSQQDQIVLSLVKQLSDLSNDFKEKQNELKHLKTIVEKNQLSMVELTQDLNECQNQNIYLRKQLEESEERATNLGRHCEELQNEINNLFPFISKIEQQNQQLRAQLLERQQEAEQYCRTIMDLEKKSQTEEDDLNKMTLESYNIESYYRDIIKETEITSVKNLEEEISKLKEQLQQKESEVKEKAQSLNEYQIKLKKLSQVFEKYVKANLEMDESVFRALFTQQAKIKESDIKLLSELSSKKKMLLESVYSIFEALM